MRDENEAIMKDNRELIECTAMMDIKVEESAAEHHFEKEIRIKVEIELEEAQIDLEKVTVEHVVEMQKIAKEC